MSAVSREVMPEHMKDWGRYEQIFDKCNIGPGVNTNVNGWYTSFTNLAQATEVPFLNVRNSAIAGRTNTNITSLDKIPWWADLHSIGLRFIAPDPSVISSSEHLGLTAMSKFFTTVLPEHAFFEFEIKSYTFINLLCSHLPAGFGPQGHFELGLAGNTGFSSLINNSNLDMPNRWKFLGTQRLPIDTPIRARITFDDYAKDMLNEWANVPGIDFGGVALFENMYQIELTVRMVTYEQRVGEFRAN